MKFFRSRKDGKSSKDDRGDDPTPSQKPIGNLPLRPKAPSLHSSVVPTTAQGQASDAGLVRPGIEASEAQTQPVRDLWSIAFDQLDDDNKKTLTSSRLHVGQSSEAAVQLVIQQTEEVYKTKGWRIRDEAKKF